MIAEIVCFVTLNQIKREFRPKHRSINYLQPRTHSFLLDKVVHLLEAQQPFGIRTGTMSTKFSVFPIFEKEKRKSEPVHVMLRI